MKTQTSTLAALTLLFAFTTALAADNVRAMKNLKGMPDEQHAEKWIQTYAAWMEMNE